MLGETVSGGSTPGEAVSGDVTPGETAVVADLAADEIDERATLDSKRLPLIIRIYGLIVLLDGLATLPIVVFSSIAAVKAIMAGELAFDAMSLTADLTAIQAVVLIVSAAAMIVFGILLIRNRRRYAARWAYVLMPITLAEGMLSLALEGLGLNIIPSGVRMVILVAVSIAADPALIEERRLQFALKRMDDKDAYERAVRTGTLGRDPSGKGYISLDFFNIFWLFTVACVFGLAIETVYHFAMYHGEWQDRAGLLWGPFSPIYGCGAVLVTVALNRLWKSNPFLIFCASALIGGAFEYATSWFMEVAFGITAWDYTGQWLSIDGRTSGKYMVFWGLIGLAWVHWILPRLLRLIQRIPWKVRYSLTAVCAVLMIVDIVLTLMALDCWYGRMAGLPQDSPVTAWFARNFDNDFMAARFQTMTLDPTKAGRV
ncbi:putative ABC transporter permease [Bifidobacterium sp. MA2]|uniref:ABC transporter permease n=1 Tax=Bifidobacterium santillanense TaxID=2809028 RepID=A0ABS5UR89_9BIFI|nr:putative ABC transporter permease [Bifidobacterium santillanense]